MGTQAHTLRRSHEARRAIRRFIRHHLVFGAASIVLIAAIAIGLPSGRAVWRLSMATAYTGLVLLALTLILGPLNVLRNRRNPVSTDLRRDIGIWAAIVGLAHVVAGSQVHLAGKAWRYVLERSGGTGPWVPRVDLFGFANDTGLLAALVLVLLVALSNDRALRVLGRRRWKALQRSNYVLFGLVAVHGLAYQRSEIRAGAYLFILCAVAFGVIALQVAGFTRRRARGTRVPSPAPASGPGQSGP
jgi:sulfoxide reductase heme-binding subunit YedZ